MRRKFEVFMVICLLATSFFLARRGAALVQSQKANQSTLCVVIDAGHGGIGIRPKSVWRIWNLILW